MDLETENRIAAILLKEANELRRQAESEGALAYLREPTVRAKPNSRFLTATVLGVQQANRAVEVNELWRLREKQEELENRIEGRGNRSSSGRNAYESRWNRSRNEMEPSASASHTSKKRNVDDLHPGGMGGLRDEEMEEFLHSRKKRGRGAVGSRMDETGPYLPCSPGSTNLDEEPQRARVFLGPQRPSHLKSSDSSDDEYLKRQKANVVGSSKKHSSKPKSKRKSRDSKKKKKREEKKRKHHK